MASFKLAQARTFPTPTGYVNDFANIISESIQSQIESDLNQHKLNTGQEVSVVTIDSLEGDTIENASVELFSQWGIGTKEKDNGVLLLIALKDRKLKIETGYGIEPILTDSRSGTIIRDVITPEFKKDDYDAGIKAGVAAILTVLTSDPTVFDSQVVAKSSDRFYFLITAGIIMIYLSAFLARSKRYWPGGVIGAVIGFLLSAVTGAILLGLFGLFLDYILSKNYKTRVTKGLPTTWWSSTGGFSGGHSSGGFGGFSGGSSGGGGSSGSW